MNSTYNNIVAQATGGKKIVLDNISTIKDARLALGLPENYVGSINGSPASDNQSLGSDNVFVSFAEKVKGA